MVLLFKPIFCLIILAVILLQHSNGLRIRGVWKSSDFYKFVIKFGFQQTDLNDKQNTFGYVYGNVTSSGNGTAKLVLTYSDLFYDLYESRKRKPVQKTCSNMFKRIDKVAYDGECRFTATDDFVRTIPCPKNDICIEEEDGRDIIQNSQFTFRIKNEQLPRFYFISLVACHHVQNSSRGTVIKPEEDCYWQVSADNFDINYDIWLVNGNPEAKHANPFEHQFSFELHNIFELYFVFFMLYLFVVPIQIYAMRKMFGLLPMLLTVSMSMTFVGMFCNLMHVLTFAFNGEGFMRLGVFGDFMDVLAQCVFMMTLLLIVKGYTITRDRMSVRARVILLSAWFMYTAGSVALFFWNMAAVDPLAEPDEWQTQPGLMILIFRLLIMAWFLLELRCSMGRETNSQMAEFYLHFGAGFLVWFVYLPILAIISSHVSILWRHKTVVSVKSCADFVSFCVLIHLLWPSRNNLIYSIQHESQNTIDDLEFEALIDDDDGLPLDPRLVRPERRPPSSKQRPARPSKHRPAASHSMPQVNKSEFARDGRIMDSTSDDDSDYAGNTALQPLQMATKVKTKNGSVVSDMPVRTNNKVAARMPRSSEDSGC